MKSSFSKEYLKNAQTYQMRINALHAMIWLCHDGDTRIPELKSKIAEFTRLKKEQEYLSFHVTTD